MRAADEHNVPAGSALAVDRDGFAAGVTARLTAHPNIEIVRERVDALPDSGPTIVATGPLTAPRLAGAIAAATGSDALAFFDAIAPIVHRDSIDMDICWFQRAGTRASEGLHQLPDGQGAVSTPSSPALIDGEKSEFREWEKDTPYFEGCMPIEVMAERGAGNAALRPDEGGRARRSAHRPLALCRGPAAPGQCARHVVEHRRLPDQAEACRAGAASSAPSRASKMPSSRGWAGMHRNTFISSPQLLDGELRLKSQARISASPARSPAAKAMSKAPRSGCSPAASPPPNCAASACRRRPLETALGALLPHITGGAEAETYQPMNVNFGLMPPIPGRSKKADRKKMYTDRARGALASGWQSPARQSGHPSEAEFRCHREHESGFAGMTTAQQAHPLRLLRRASARRGGRIFGRGSAIPSGPCRRRRTWSSSSPPIRRTTARHCRWGRAWRRPCAAAASSSSASIRPFLSLSAREKRFSSRLLAVASGAWASAGATASTACRPRRRRGGKRRSLLWRGPATAGKRR